MHFLFNGTLNLNNLIIQLGEAVWKSILNLSKIFQEKYLILRQLVDNMKAIESSQGNCYPRLMFSKGYSALSNFEQRPAPFYLLSQQWNDCTWETFHLLPT